jgi:hypothetical protein
MKFDYVYGGTGDHGVPFLLYDSAQDVSGTYDGGGLGSRTKEHCNRKV